jgi:hypothetical protein
MSRRTSIVKAVAEKLKVIDGTTAFKSNIFNNSFPYLKFWDETKDFPSIYTIAGSEQREYLPSDFTWGFLNLTLKVYTKGEFSQQLLEDLLEDIENVLHDNRRLEYDSVNMYSTEEILISSIVTDEGLLAPYAIGEISIQVRYQII